MNNKYFINKNWFKNINKNLNLYIEKEFYNIKYFLNDKKSCIISFKNKSDLMNFIKKYSIKIDKITHVNYNLSKYDLPF